ncbi:ATP-binding domain-containing protein [Kitasatospora sp. McL0602]|uniref:ATP-binding domain-containing protein n=1 Tax=Kitasatospora sp. McL0602 TaxID=3439530 RepID=UPI003F89F98B
MGNEASADGSADGTTADRTTADRAAAVAALTAAVRKIEGAGRPAGEIRVQRKADRIAEQAKAEAEAEAAAEAAAAAALTAAPVQEGEEESAVPEAASEPEREVERAVVVEQLAPAPSRRSPKVAAPARAAVPVPVLLDEQRVAAIRATTEVLHAGGARTDIADAVVAALGEGAAEQLRADPWALLAVPGLPGLRPDHVDSFARGLLGPAAGPGDPRRAGALVSWLLEQAALRGHTAQETSEIAAGLENFAVPDAASALQEVVTDGGVMAFQEEITGPGAATTTAAEDEDGDDEPPTRTLLALERIALAEESLADGLVRVMSTFEVPETPGPAEWEAAAAAAPSASAAALLRAAAGNGLTTHTGGEAAKTELAALLDAARGLGLRAWAATWTDQGRDSFAALLPGSADAPPTEATEAVGEKPVAVLAELLAGTAGPGHAEDGSLALDVLVVLDAPLLDIELAATLLEALADGTRLVLSGDLGQLWSAGPGRVFADLVAAKACPAVASRTPDFGPIGELVSGIGVGELQPVDAPGKEVVILTAKDGGEAVHRAIQLLTDSIPRALGIPVEQVTLLTPGHGGSAGTRVLNAAAKARLNPGPGRFGGFDPGDRVVHSPVPGVSHPGRVLDGDAAGLHVELTDGTRLTLTPAEATKLRHGWAMTVHQAVGRRWPGVIAVLPDDAAAGLTRQLVYTAFGRAERHLSVVHAAGQALPQAVVGREAQPRTTRLRGILTEA